MRNCSRRCAPPPGTRSRPPLGRPALKLVWSRLPSLARPPLAPSPHQALAPLEVDGVEVVYCQTYAEAKACI